MAEASLKAEIWVKAQIRLCDINFLPAAVLKRGDPDAGAIVLKLNRLDAGHEVYTQVRDQEGKRAWMRGTGDQPVSETDASSYIEKQAKFDPDLWVLEIEDPKYKYEIDGKVL
jgi:hypothetical protein